MTFENIDELRQKIKTRLMTDYDILIHGDIDESRVRECVDEVIASLPSKEREKVQEENVCEEVVRSIMDSIAGLGPLKVLVDDSSISEIMVNGPSKIFVERAGRMDLTDLKFRGEREIMNVVQKIVGPTQRRVDESNPYVDISLSDGSRVNIILPPLSLTGPAITIRKFSQELRSIEDLISKDTLNQKMADFLIAAVRTKLNILFSGSTGTGKTTTLNILSHYIPDHERIVTIEDTAELRLTQENVVRLETRLANVEGRGIVTIRDLFRNCLRMRPDRIILGEIRSDEVLDMLQSISSGHGGTMAIIHGGSPQEVVSRMETMIALSSVSLPVSVIRRQIASAIDIIVHQDQLTDGSRKITHIAEVKEVVGEEIVLQDLFYYKTEDKVKENKIIGEWKKTSHVPLFIHKLQRVNSELSEEFFKRSY